MERNGLTDWKTNRKRTGCVGRNSGACRSRERVQGVQGVRTPSFLCTSGAILSGWTPSFLEFFFLTHGPPPGKKFLLRMTECVYSYAGCKTNQLTSLDMAGRLSNIIGILCSSSGLQTSVISVMETRGLFM